MNDFKKDILYLTEMAREPFQTEWMPKAEEAINDIINRNSKENFLTSEESKLLQATLRYLMGKRFRREYHTERKRRNK